MKGNNDENQLASSTPPAFIRWLRKIFGKKAGKTPAQPVEPAKAPGITLDDDSHYDEYVKHIVGMDDVVVRLGLHQRINAAHKYIYEMGRRDGSLGVKGLSLVQIVLAAARELFTHTYVMLKGKLAALKADYDATLVAEKHDDKRYQHEKTYYDYVKYQYRFFPRSHSWGLFVIYLVVALLLVVADIPLALKLISNGFDLTGGPTLQTGFGYLFMSGYTKNVLAFNWETFATALGIAFCTIYIKIYYDEFVGTPFGNRLMTFRRFLEENGIENMEENIANVQREHKHKRSWKTAILVLTLASIIVLGVFRLQTAAAAGDGSTVHFSIWASLAFILITLLFPLIGGICLSYAFNNFQNLMRLRKAGKECDRARSKWEKALVNLTAAEKNHKDLVSADARLCNEEKMLPEYQEYLLTSYQRGYAIGSMQPERYIRGEDFFTKILEWRNIAVSRKIQTNISNQN